MSKNRIYQGLLLLCVVVIAIQAYFLSSLTKKEIVTAPAKGGEITENIRQYVWALAGNDWQKASEYLTGEALLLHERNTSSVGNTYRAELRDFKVKDIQTWGQELAVVEAESVLAQGDHLETHQARYHLIKIDGNWKIYGQEETPERLPRGIDKKEAAAAGEVVAKTLTSITAGQWAEALVNMTGLARREGERTLATGQQPLVSTIRNIQITPLQVDGEYGWFLASYSIEPNQLMTKESTVKITFKLQKIQGVWKVYRTEMVELR